MLPRLEKKYIVLDCFYLGAVILKETLAQGCKDSVQSLYQVVCYMIMCSVTRVCKGIKKYNKIISQVQCSVFYAKVALTNPNHTDMKTR